jgi:hypothetical protein
LGRVTIDCTGIEVLSGLKNISMEYCNTVIHIEELAGLKNIETLCLDISGPDQTLGFLSTMTSLRTLYLYGDYNDTAIYLFGKNNHNYIRIDVSPLKALVNLEMLSVQGFTIENFHILNELPELRHVDVYNSRFYPEDNNSLTRDDIGIIRELQSDR